MESVSRAFRAWLRSPAHSTPNHASSLRIWKNLQLPGGERCDFVTVTTIPGDAPAQSPSRVIDLWDLGPGAVGPRDVRRMSLNLHLVEAWAWDRQEFSRVAGGRVEVRGNLVGRTVGDEAIFEILGNCGRRLRLWTYEGNCRRLQVNPYVPAGTRREDSSELDQLLTEPNFDGLLDEREGRLTGATFN